MAIMVLIGNFARQEVNIHERFGVAVSPEAHMCAYFVSEDGKEILRGVINSVENNMMNVSYCTEAEFDTQPLQSVDLIISDWSVYIDNKSCLDIVFG